MNPTENTALPCGRVRLSVEPARRCPHSAVGAIQEAIRGVEEELRRIQDRIAQLCATPADPDEPFEPLAQLCGVLECVSSDLLSDAIETLAVVGSLSQAQLRDEFETTQQRLAHPRRIS